MHPDTRAVHAATTDPVPGRPLSVPIYQTAGFEHEDPSQVAEGLNGPDGPFVYTRYTNPTVRALEDAVAGLEHGIAGLAAASGMGVINAVVQASVRTGDHIIAQRALYGGTHSALNELAARFQIAVSRVGGHDPEELRSALRPETRLLYLETIANPVGHVSDVPALAEVARAAGVLTVVDNTLATPMLFRPLEHGADVVVHSATKYLGGHSDLIGGVAAFADERIHRRVWAHSLELGATTDPFAAWLTLRGLQTLPLRMARHRDNATFVAERLARHPAVAAVHWPGLPHHPSHAVARRLLDGYGATFSFDLVGGREAGRALISKLGLVRSAPSLGGVESLVLHPASTSHRQLTPEELRAVGIGEGTVRISVGVENAHDLWADLEQALGA